MAASAHTLFEICFVGPTPENFSPSTFEESTEKTLLNPKNSIRGCQLFRNTTLKECCSHYLEMLFYST